MRTFKSLALHSCLFFSGIVLFFTSCSDNSYLNAIPGESTALISIDMQKMEKGSPVRNEDTVLKSILHVKDISDCGIDVDHKMYFFESQDGNLGLCAKVKDHDDLQNWLHQLSQKGTCPELSEHRGLQFTVLKNAWVLGFSHHAMLIMGPVTVSAQAEMIQQMATYLKEDEDDGIKSSPLFDALDTISSPMAMVAQAQALPQKLVAPFTIGIPRGADASQVLIAADIKKDGKALLFHGKTFSFNHDVDAALKKAVKVYRPITGRYASTMPSDAVVGIFMNVDGRKFLPLMQNNRGLTALLAGINEAIDVNSIMNSVNGDMNIILPTMDDKSLEMMWGAKLANCNWLGDVDYWKQSVPKGGKILDSGKNAYYYTDKKTTFYFGASDDLQFYSGSSAILARNSILKSKDAIPSSLQKLMIGKKMVMIINLENTKRDKKQNALSLFTGFLSPLFGQVGSIVYILR
jgi:hypothetical protein